MQANEAFNFAGRHLIASYLDCDLKRLTDVEALLAAMKEAVNKCGASLLNESHHVFEGNGMTAVMLLSESHASIHTYPEHNACFVDIFTCGDHCSPEAFDKVLREYLRPEKVSVKLLCREGHIDDISHEFTHPVMEYESTHETYSFAPPAGRVTVA